MSFLQESLSENNALAPYFEKYTIVRESYEKTEKLLNQELDEYIKIGVVLNKNLIIDKLFSVTIKVFDGPYELEKVGFNSKNLNISESESVYMIEIHISELFQNKIIGDNWFASVKISDNAKNGSISSVAKLKNLVPTQSFKMLVPYHRHSQPLVTVQIFAPYSDFWPNLVLDSTKIDISYFFIPFDHQSLKSQPKNPFYEISRLYSPDESPLKLKIVSPKFYEYNFTCASSRTKFLEMLLKNCYHRLNLDQLHRLVGDQSFDVNLGVCDTKAGIKYDLEKGVLKINSSLKYLSDIKKYVVGAVEEDEYFVDSSILVSLQVSAADDL